MKFIQIYKCQKGLTLIELMIAIVVGLILVAGVIQVFVANKQTYRITDAQSRLQDNARFALEILTRDIRSAGFSGCRSIEKMNLKQIANSPVPTQMGENTIIRGSEADSSTSWSPVLELPVLSEILKTKVVAGTDVITLQHGTSCGATLMENIGNSGDDIKVVFPNSCNITAGNTLMIADCEDAHIFRATSENISSDNKFQLIVHKETNNQSNEFCKTYLPSPDPNDPSIPLGCNTPDKKLYNYDAEVFKFTAVTYFIHREDDNDPPALWAYDQTTANASELIEGIEDLQVLYGSDDNDDEIVDRYVTAKVIEDANDWDKVISAQISILVQTLDTNLTTSNQSVEFNGTTIAGTEGRLRRVFSSTIAIRNRVQ
jgi:type IV pilus assembly protein PilW